MLSGSIEGLTKLDAVPCELCNIFYKSPAVGHFTVSFNLLSPKDPVGGGVGRNSPE